MKCLKYESALRSLSHNGVRSTLESRNATFEQVA
jgi:hypothetical protein